jgi:hypothetical protein
MKQFIFFNGELFKNIFQNSLGAIAFGTYHWHNYNKIMELNNDKINIQHKYLLDKTNEKHLQEISHIKKHYEKRIKELNDKLNKN